ncbi:hypothetical protein [Pseudomonas sp. CGJS7]|uniref:hypothetical protein n=1 Tax=Pseudomonas sp. CGJS7 TaxID=3109348 RepID=UPI0030086405
MSVQSLCEKRVSPLVAAVCTIGTAAAWMVLAPSVAAIGDEARAQVAHHAGMQEILIKYRSGGARLDADRLNRMLRESEAGFGRDASLQRVRRTSAGLDVIRAGRRLGEGEALALVRRLARNPQVEYASTQIKSTVRRASAVEDTDYSEIWASSQYDGDWTDRWSVHR